MNHPTATQLKNIELLFAPAGFVKRPALITDDTATRPETAIESKNTGNGVQRVPETSNALKRADKDGDNG